MKPARAGGCGEHVSDLASWVWFGPQAVCAWARAANLGMREQAQLQASLLQHRCVRYSSTTAPLATPRAAGRDVCSEATDGGTVSDPFPFWGLVII